MAERCCSLCTVDTSVDIEHRINIDHDELDHTRQRSAVVAVEQSIIVIIDLVDIVADCGRCARIDFEQFVIDACHVIIVIIIVDVIARQSSTQDERRSTSETNRKKKNEMRSCLSLRFVIFFRVVDCVDSI